MEWVIVAAVVVVAAGVQFQRKIHDPDSAFGEFYRARLRPRLAQAVKAALFLTLILWFALYLTAPEEDRGDLGDLFKGLFQSFGGGDEDPL